MKVVVWVVFLYFSFKSFVGFLNDICAELINIDPDNRQVQALIQVIREKLHLYADTQADVHLAHAVAAYTTLHTTSENYRITYTDTLRACNKQLNVRQRRDLRQCYRRIIRFLFKNLEADDHDSAYLSQPTRTEQLFMMIRQLNNENKSSAHRLLTTIRGRPGYIRKEEKRNTQKNQAIPAWQK